MLSMSAKLLILLSLFNNSDEQIKRKIVVDLNAKVWYAYENGNLIKSGEANVDQRFAAIQGCQNAKLLSVYGQYCKRAKIE